MHTDAMTTRTPAEFAKEAHRQFTVLREGQAAAAEYAKAVDDVRIVTLVDGAVDETLLESYQSA